MWIGFFKRAPLVEMFRSDWKLDSDKGAQRTTFVSGIRTSLKHRLRGKSGDKSLL